MYNSRNMLSRLLFVHLNTAKTIRLSEKVYSSIAAKNLMPYTKVKSIASDLAVQNHIDINIVNNENKSSLDLENLNEMKSLIDNEIHYAVTMGDGDEKEIHAFNSVELYGYADSFIPISDIPCSGCGANLHCQNAAIPGYMPSQLFKTKSTRELKNSSCQRCELMNKYNFALNVSVKSKEYSKIISQIHSIDYCLAVVVIDILDMSNSIYPELSKLIGTNKPLYIVGNKVDLLPTDKPGYLERIKKNLRDQCVKRGLGTNRSIKHVALISAKTGFGIEQLITKLLLHWYRKGHVYILGCTNSGKSTLFNAFLSSDYCNANVRSVINRATTCSWPGTTLNLLKFPIVNPSGPFLFRRKERLHHLDSVDKERMLERTKGKISYKQTLLGHIGMTDEYNRYTFHHSDISGGDEAMYTYKDSVNTISNTAKRKENIPQQYSYDEKVFKKSRWCYDTPGLVNENQLINRMNQDELSVLLNQDEIIYRNFRIQKGDVMFVSGLGRVDVLDEINKNENFAIFSVFTNKNIPIYIVKSNMADDVYKRNIGTSYFGIPLGDVSRLNRIPSLVGKEIEVEGLGYEECAADISLSSLGWLSVSAAENHILKLRVYLPGGMGCSVSLNPLLPYIDLNSTNYKVKSPRKHNKNKRTKMKNEDMFGLLN